MLDPEGWEYLAKLYTQMHTLKLFQSEEEESTLIDKITDAWKKGIQLGWSASYTGMLTHLKKHYKNPDKSFENIVEDFGPSPCAGLPELLEKFIAGKA